MSRSQGWLTQGTSVPMRAIQCPQLMGSLGLTANGGRKPCMMQVTEYSSWWVSSAQ